MKKITMIFAVLGLLMATAYAEEREQGACRADVEKFCKGIAPGGGAIARCLGQHRAELSSQCRDKMAQGKKRAGEFAQACKADADKLCKQVQPGGGRVIRCLEGNKAQLSTACRQKIEEAEKRHPCMPDIERLCKDVQGGKGRVANCLKQHESEVTPACKAAMEKKGKHKQ
jgi:hypothetical protein